MLHNIFMSSSQIWLAIGFFGQFLFFMRFFVQWLASERAQKSVIPVAFWFFSIGGGFILFLYAVFHLKDPVISLGQGMGLFIYARNLYLVHKEKKLRDQTPSPSPV
jgi:lipid-A-disaccharide synthase-like uncharacterized protein